MYFDNLIPNKTYYTIIRLFVTLIKYPKSVKHIIGKKILQGKFLLTSYSFGEYISNFFPLEEKMEQFINPIFCRRNFKDVFITPNPYRML